MLDKSEILPSSVFRANDIRGFADGEITPSFARLLARAFASLAKEANQKTICICRDGRLSSHSLWQALKSGLLESGVKIIDLGCGPTPLLCHYVITNSSLGAGIMITASHNSKEYNGFKIILNKDPFCGEQLQILKQRMFNLSCDCFTGELLEIDSVSSYLQQIQEDIGDLNNLKICIDGANGSAGPLAVNTFNKLGCEVNTLYCDIDGNFPNHGPDPCKSNNLKDLSSAVLKNNCQMGIGLDGDGDRMVAVDDLGRILSPDQLYLIFARDILKQSPGASLVFDVKASSLLKEKIQAWGGQGIMEKSGRTFIQARVKESGALLGGEYSSHYFFQDRWNAIDDGIYAACRLAKIVRISGEPLSKLVNQLPLLPATEELEILVAEEQKTEIYNQFRQNADFEGAKLIEIDGLRIEYPQAWGLVRISNTGAKLSVRFEGKTHEALADIQKKVQQVFKQVEQQLNIQLNLPF